MRNRGYTLVELLVVIAIIAILAAMMAPVLLQAKDSARVRTCADNLRQLGAAMIRYMDDHDGYGLPAPPDSAKRQYRNPWILYVKPLLPNYVPQGGVPFTPAESTSSYPYDGTGYGPTPRWIWVCRGDTYRGHYPPPPGKDDISYPCWFNFGSSYLYPGPTAYLSGTWAEQVTNIYPRKVLQWKNHRRDLLLADNYPDMHGGSRIARDDKWLHPFPPKPTWVEVRSINVLFLDLHIRMATLGERLYYQDIVVNDDNPYK
jgi:prepilin-type N-terminal cleavage/methylation domain-containing protein